MPRPTTPRYVLTIDSTPMAYHYHTSRLALYFAQRADLLGLGVSGRVRVVACGHLQPLNING